MKSAEAVGATKRALLLGAVLAAFWAIFGVPFLVWGMNGPKGPWWHYDWPEALFLLLLALPLLAAKAFNERELAVFWAVISPVALLPWACFLLISGFVHAAGSKVVPAEVHDYIPSWLAPKSLEALLPLKSQAYAGKAVWGAWAAPIAIFIVFLLAWQLWWLANAAIWRRYMIDIERLPFPVASVVYNVGLVGVKPEARRNRLFWAGVLVGILWYLPYLIAQWEKVFGKVLSGAFFYYKPGWPKLIGYGNFCILNSKMAALFFSLNLFLIAFGFLLPLDILLSGWVAYLIVWIIIPALGVMAGVVPVKGTDFWAIYWNWGFTTGLTAVIMFTYGGLLGLALGQLIFGAGYLLRTLKGERAEGEPLEYRKAWAMWFACAFIVFIIMVASGVPVAEALLLMVFFYLTFLGQLRIRAEYGATGGHWYQNWANAVAALPFVSAGTWHTKAAFMTSMWAGSVCGTGFFEGNFAERSLDAFKLAALTGTPARDVFTGYLVGIVVSALIIVPFWVWFMNHYGWYGDAWAGVRLSLDVWKTGSWTQAGAWPKVGINYLIGAAIILVLMFLRRYVAWWPLHPVGFVIMAAPWLYFGSPVIPGLGDGWAGPSYGGGWFAALFLPWLIKYIVLKVGGTKLYEKLVPFFTGIIVGIIIISFINSLYFLGVNWGSWATIDRWTKY